MSLNLTTLIFLIIEERRPTVNELANQRAIVQKASGWKLYHLAAQLEELVGDLPSLNCYIYLSFFRFLLWLVDIGLKYEEPEMMNIDSVKK